MSPQEALRFNCCIRLNKKDMSYKQVWFIVLQNRMLKIYIEKPIYISHSKLK